MHGRKLLVIFRMHPDVQKSYICFMELKLNMPFQQLLTLIKSLTPKQRERLKKELDEPTPLNDRNDDFIGFLLKGPIYSKDDIDQIMENRNSISAWRTGK